jgi:hypothetical protein
MARALMIALMLLAFSFGKQLHAQELDGPGYRLTAVSTTPAAFDALLEDWKKNFQPRFEALKDEGRIEDYKLFFSIAPYEWDLLISVEYDDFSVVETLTEIDEEMDRVYRKVEPSRRVQSYGNETVSSRLTREVEITKDTRRTKSHGR